MNNIFQKAVALYVMAFLILSNVACNEKKEGQGWLKLSGETMGTTYHITVNSLSQVKAQTLIDSVLMQVSDALSTYDSNSYISRFNHSLDGSFEHNSGDEINEMLFRAVWDAAKLNYKRSNGAFDPSASPLFVIWGFAEKNRAGIPDSVQINDAMRDIGFGDSLFPMYQKTSAKATLNFNAIAKGYGVDCVYETLTNAGAKNVMVEIGGEVRATGTNESEQVWRIGINRPAEEAASNDHMHIVNLQNRAMATSGNYRNYFYHEGKKYSHTIDPTSGYPIENNLKSVSILAPDCTTADALATACMVLGLEKSIKLIESLPEIEAILIYEEDGTLKLISVTEKK